MTKRQFLLILVPFFILTISGLLLYPGKRDSRAGEPAPSVEQIITFAMVGSEPNQVRARLDPFVDFINQFLGDREIIMNPFVAESKAAIKRAIQNGEVDFYLDSPFFIYGAVETGVMKPVARQWRDGVAEYHSVILSRKGAPLRDFKDLHQLSIAFEDQDSSSSFFLPASMLRKAGYTLVESGIVNTGTDEPFLHYQFSGWDKTSLDWLLAGKVDLAAVSSIFYDELPPELKDGVHVVRESPQIPRHLMAVRTTLHPEIEDLVTGILMDLETSSEGRAVLREFYNTRRFDPIPYESELRQRILQQLGIIAWEF
jgi:phosphonate transport system substrate-binding protein